MDLPLSLPAATLAAGLPEAPDHPSNERPASEDWQRFAGTATRIATLVGAVAPPRPLQ